MRFNRAMVSRYRNINGNILIVKDAKMNYYDVYAEYVTTIPTVGPRKRAWLESHTSKQRAVREARRLALLFKLDFDTEQDIIA